MLLHLFTLSPAAQRAWLAEQLARPTPKSARSLSEAFRLPRQTGALVPAAVLVGLVNRPEGLQVLFTERSAHVSNNPGQISFPGGRVEADDADAAAAALRETQEEIGLPPAHVDILGELAPLETLAGYRIRPVVGWIEPRMALAPNPLEVASVFEVPLDFLVDPANHIRHFRMLGELRRDYWAMPYKQHHIWGTTAAVLLILARTLQASE
jgi:8-oxo-dGTP pyrophosphatase MutT (NUDIX family)